MACMTSGGKLSKRIMVGVADEEREQRGRVNILLSRSELIYISQSHTAGPELPWSPPSALASSGHPATA